MRHWSEITIGPCFILKRCTFFHLYLSITIIGWPSKLAIKLSSHHDKILEVAYILILGYSNLNES